MTYSSPPFILFISFGILVFYLIPAFLQAWWLLLMSFIWYASWGVEWLFIMFGVINLNYLGLRYIDKVSTSAKNTSFSLLVLLNAFIFVILKSGGIGPYTFQTPYGTSFYIFIIIAVIVDRWRSASYEPMPKWQEFSLLPSFFPLIMGGPIEKGKDFWHDLRSDKTGKLWNIVDGILIFSWGLFKKKALYDVLNHTYDTMLWSGERSSYYFLRGFINTFVTYLEFSSICDMGRGMAKTFGINLSVSFRPFYMANSPNDFWQRWNITLGKWIRDYVSFPLMLRYGRQLNQNILLIFTFLLVGLWHQFNTTWINFGVFNGLVVVIYNFLNKKVKVPYLGIFFAYLIIIGNGIVLNMAEFMNTAHVASEVNDGDWIRLINNWSPLFITQLVAFFVIELIGEYKNDVDWYLKSHKIVKGILVIGLLFAFVWALDLGILTEKNKILAPSYFKI